MLEKWRMCGKMPINIIVAFDDKFTIGNKGRIPWKISEDMQNFRNLTMGNSVILGRRTWDSIIYKPLVGRANIILTRNNPGENQANVRFVKTLEESLIASREMMPDKDIYVIGGTEIYKLFLDANLVDKIIASKIPGSYDGDTFFPDVFKDWKLQNTTPFKAFELQEYVK